MVFENAAENLKSNLLVIGILLALVFLGYSKMRNKSIPDIIREIREAFKKEPEVLRQQ